jgi:hypothetical protein
MDHATDPAASGEEPQAPPAGELVPLAPEVIETVLVAGAGSPLAPAERPALPVVHAAAVAAGGFLAGAAVAGAVSRRRRRAPIAAKRSPRLLRRRAGARRQSTAGEVLQVVASRSLLVDVHLLGLPGADR